MHKGSKKIRDYGTVQTFTRTVVPKATSNLHSHPARRLTCVGGGGAYCVSGDDSVSSRPGRDIALLEDGDRQQRGILQGDVDKDIYLVVR